MTNAYVVTYNGKKGGKEDDLQPVPGLPVPFHVGEQRLFDEDYCTAHGIADCEAFVRGFADYSNRRGYEVFTVEKASKDAKPSTQQQTPWIGSTMRSEPVTPEEAAASNSVAAATTSESDTKPGTAKSDAGKKE